MNINLARALSRNRTGTVLLLLATIFAVHACGREEAAAQDSSGYTLVADLAIAVMLKPEFGDQIIAKNRELYDSKFYSAIDDRIEFFAAYAANHYKYCNEFRTEPRANQQCYQENEPAKNRHLLQTLKNATRNNPVWSNSTMAYASVLGKQAIGEEKWVSLQKAFFAQVRPLFIVN